MVKMMNKKNRKKRELSKFEIFINLCTTKIKDIIIDIPENPGFFVMFSIGLFGFFESTDQGVHSILFGDKYTETVQAIMFGVGFWGMISSAMLVDRNGVDDPENDYWINFWLLSHLIKFLIFLILSWKLALDYALTRVAVYIGLIIIDMVIINKAIYENKKVKSNRILLSKINDKK